MDSSFLSIVLCPGIHDPVLTEGFVAALRSITLNASDPRQLLVVPAQDWPVYSPHHILQFLSSLPSVTEPLFIGFSAGVVGAIGAAQILHRQGVAVKALIAIDGWGVPLAARFPVYRLSHDQFTDWSSALLGGGLERFYADPAVDHLAMWQSPQRVCGTWVRSLTPQAVANSTPMLDFLRHVLNFHGEI
jgi:hypothetical protein